MNGNKMWDFKEWNKVGRNLLDLSYEANTSGAIPLQCPGFSKNGKPCQAKLRDGMQNIKKRTCCVSCQFCDWEGQRVLGRMKRGC